VVSELLADLDWSEIASVVQAPDCADGYVQDPRNLAAYKADIYNI